MRLDIISFPFFLALALAISLAFNLYAESGSKVPTLVLVGGGTTPTEAIKHAMDKGGSDQAEVLYVRWAHNPLLREDKGELKPLDPEKTPFFAFQPKTIIDAVPRSELLQIEGHRIKFVDQLKRANLIFFAGGDQDFIMDVLNTDEARCKKAVPQCKTFKDLIREKYLEGTPIIGTSAGTAIMSLIMITSDEDKGQAENFRFTSGLGLLPPEWIVDQHFDKAAGRRHRMKEAVKRHPRHYGLGIYENSAVIVLDGKWVEPVGEVNGLGSQAEVFILSGPAGDQFEPQRLRPGFQLNLQKRQIFPKKVGASQEQKSADAVIEKAH